LKISPDAKGVVGSMILRITETTPVKARCLLEKAHAPAIESMDGV